MMAASARRHVAPLSAYVLHRYDWSESSVILDLFTREKGRLAVIAKGAKRPYSQLRPVLMPFQRLHVSLGRGQADGEGEVQVLRHAEWTGDAGWLSGAGLFTGFYLNELLLKSVARQDPHPRLFDAYVQTLPLLGVPDESTPHAALRAFELVLLHDTGVLPDLCRITATQQEVREGGGYTLRPEIGVAEAGIDTPSLPGSLLRAIQHGLEANMLGDVQRATVSAPAALKSVLRALLHYHLGTSSLRTRQAMMEVQNLLDSSRPPLT